MTAGLNRGETVFAGVRNPERADALQALKASFESQLHVLQLDVNHEVDRQGAIAAISPHGALDLLIHNAGINSKSKGMAEGLVRFGTLTESALMSYVKTNAIAPLLLTQTLEPLLTKSKSAVVIAISSWFASLEESHERDFNYSYSGSKTLLNMYFRLAGNTLKSKGITTLIVNPGWMQTDMGGGKATLTPETVAESIYTLEQKADTTMAAQFFDWNGDRHPW